MNAKEFAGDSMRHLNSSFRKAWAWKVQSRLSEMKAQEEKEDALEMKRKAKELILARLEFAEGMKLKIQKRLPYAIKNILS